MFCELQKDTLLRTFFLLDKIEFDNPDPNSKHRRTAMKIQTLDIKKSVSSQKKTIKIESTIRRQITALHER